MSEDHAPEVLQTEQEADEGEEAGCIMVYECSQVFVGIHYHSEDIVFQSIGHSREEAVDDMLDTLNYMPESLEEIAEDDADLVDVRPLRVTEPGGGADAE